MLSPTQARLQDDLRGLIEGEVRCDETTLHLYATDASLFATQPAGVVWPKSTKDVVACVHYAAEKNLSIHPRGAGTGRGGGALGTGLILDFTRFMRRLIRVDDEIVVVQPGAIRSRINAMLRRSHDRMIGPDPGFSPATTLGSWFACDGAGMSWLKYGSPRNSIAALEVVLANGEVLSVSSEHVGEERLHGEQEKQIFRGVRDCLAPSLREICLEQSNSSPDRAGYRLEGVMHSSPLGEQLSDGINLARLFAGSEGTLALVTEMQIKTVPCPLHRGNAIFLFDSLEKATRAVSALLPHRPNCCELLDRRRINMVREWDKRFQPFLPQETEAVLFVEIDASQSHEIADRLNAMLDDLQTGEQLCFSVRHAYGQEELDFFRDFLHKGEIALARMALPYKALPFFEEIAVPIDKLPAFLVLVQNIFKRHDVFASFSGHVGHGHLRVNPIINTARENVTELILRLVEEVYTEVIRQGGTISSDGVCGRIGAQFLPQQHQFLFPVFQSIKTLFDPQNLFNPGKIIAPENDTTWVDSLR
ncbi:MAG: FAD-binding oxidoreductase [Planctomycetaceae bacterium]|nr:FAD-binding oxidoreductase [Planctomycetaceae bacterium]